MLKPRAFAHAVSIALGAGFTICGLLAFILPDAFFAIVASWFHMINLELIRSTEPMSVGTFIIGVVTFIFSAWISAYTSAYFYNKLAK